MPAATQILMLNDEVPDEDPTPIQKCGKEINNYNEKFHLVITGTDIPLSNTRYRISASSGEIFEGWTDSQGFTERVYTATAATLVLEVLETYVDDIDRN